DEHQAVRSGAGLFDISHMGRLQVGGPDALDLIQHVYTNNAATLKVGQVRYGLVCNSRGGIRDDVLVYRWPHDYSMVVNASNREKILSWLGEHQGARDVQVVDQTFDTCMIAVQGPKAIELCKGLTEADPSALGYYFATATKYQGEPCILSRTGYTGEDGVELSVGKKLGTALWEELIKRGAVACGLGARDTLRLEAAMPLYGHELNEDIDPYQAGLAWAVKPDKGEFLGKDAMLRRKADPQLKQRVGLVLEGKRIAREGASVLDSNKEIGHVTSGTFAPTLARTIAMAYLDPEHAVTGSECVVDLRGKTVPARVVPLPFYRRPK
ncbi:MAG: glycine cleavage system aminomethyltransferase GcvT, partial [Gemmataceae bacterium]